MADPQFRPAATGEREPFEAEADETEIPPAGRYLTARWMVLADGTRLRQHRPVRGQHRSRGFERLDNEILAGRQLYEVTGGRGCPPEVSQFYGDDDDTAGTEPFALFQAYRGAPLSEVGDSLDRMEQEQFHVSLLRGLCWLAAAGIAHRALNPDTVWWDGERAQITDFSLSAVFGAPRTPVPGEDAWVAREQREGTFAGGWIGERDDIWAAGLLIGYVRNNGVQLYRKSDLGTHGLAEKLQGVFEAADIRPPASELLRRLGMPSPAPGWTASSREWRMDRESFLEERRRLHPGGTDPKNFNADIGVLAGPGGPPGGGQPAAGTR